MNEDGVGSLNVSSAAAELPVGPPFSASMVARRGTAYGSTKAMLNRFTASLAVELYGTGIAVNAFSPQAATATEGVLASIETGRIKTEQTEPLETMVEATLGPLHRRSRQPHGADRLQP